MKTQPQKPDLIVGHGQIGTALGKILNIKNFHDPIKNEIFTGTCRVLNICIPYSKKFVRAVQEAIYRFKPDFTIIHSTVAVGTTKKCGKKIAYSFVRSRHNTLQNMTKHFKHLAATDPQTLKLAAAYLERAGFKVCLHENPDVVELGKLLDTTYYGLCIAYTKEAKRFSDYYGLNWKEIELMNKTYNYGYFAEGHDEFIRPNLVPMPGPIGGHCVVPNAKILAETFSSKVLKLIIESK